MKKILIGIVTGIICGMFASGGGLILVPIFTCIFKLDEKEARATSIFCILPMVVLTSIVYSKNDFIDWSLGMKCAIGGTIGGFIGSKILSKIPDKILKIAFIGFMFYAGFSIILK